MPRSYSSLHPLDSIPNRKLWLNVPSAPDPVKLDVYVQSVQLAAVLNPSTDISASKSFVFYFKSYKDIRIKMLERCN
jgi:hypothetical protein